MEYRYIILIYIIILGKGNIGEYVVLITLLPCKVLVCFNWPHLRSVCIAFIGIAKYYIIIYVIILILIYKMCILLVCVV